MYAILKYTRREYAACNFCTCVCRVSTKRDMATKLNKLTVIIPCDKHSLRVTMSGHARTLVIAGAGKHLRQRQDGFDGGTGGAA
jgi:hypothetical protein